MKEPLTAVFEKSPHGYIGYVEELPGANTQGETLEEDIPLTVIHCVSKVKEIVIPDIVRTVHINKWLPVKPGKNPGKRTAVNLRTGNNFSSSPYYLRE